MSADGKFDWDEDTPAREAVFQALGAASMCWRPTPHGVFADDLARDVGEQLMAFLDKARVPPLDPSGAHLGLATTKDMIAEIRARFRTSPPRTAVESLAAAVLDHLATVLPEDRLLYRTVRR